MSLTAHGSEDAIVRRLILDALALSAHVPEVPSLADLGSGAGFPGLPFAIARPECRVTLVDSRRRCFHFQRAVIRELGLRNARPLLGRVEKIDPEPHGAVIAQALAPPAKVLPWMLRWAASDGILLLPGSQRLPKPPAMAAISSSRVLRYRVPLGGPARTLWIGERAAREKIGRDLPRCGT